MQTRLHQVGRGVREANGRRDVALWGEEAMRAERRSEWCNRVGRSSLSRGRFFKI